MAALRLNIPVIFVSGGPMEAGKTKLAGQELKLDLVDAMVAAADPSVSDEEAEQYERSACPTCGSCSGMFTANSMNCLTEALGLSLPGNGSLLATHADREQLFLRAGRRIVEITKQYYEQDNESVLPRNVASFKAFENAMMLDIAMGGSTNTILHLLAAAQEAETNFTLEDIDPRHWNPGVCTQFAVAVNLPEDLTPGEYSWHLHLPDASPRLAPDSRFTIRFANQEIWNAETGEHQLVTDWALEN